MTDDVSQWAALLNEPDVIPISKWPVPEQHGPLRHYDKTMTCVSTATSTTHRKCGAPTFWKLNGIPTCSTHALFVMNKMLYERGGE